MARASLSGRMTAQRRTSTPMTCPARRRCGDSRSEEATGFRSGSRTTASRFSPIARATSPSSGSPTDGGAAQRLTKPEPGTSHIPESWSPKGDRFLFSVKKGSDFSLWTYSLRDRNATPFGEVCRRIPPTPCSRLMDDGWPTRVRSGTGRRSTSSPSRVRSQVSAPGRSVRDRLAAAVVSGRKGTVLQPGPGRFAWVSVTTQPTFTFGNPETVPQTVPNRSSSERRAFDITPDGKFVGLDPSGTNGVRRADRSAAPSGPQLVRRVEKTRACDEVVIPFSAPRPPPRSRARSAAGASGIRSRARGTRRRRPPSRRAGWCRSRATATSSA